MDDPANLPFMESISRGECPAELEPAVRDTQITVNLVRSHEPYTPPARPAYVAFRGTGRTLAGERTHLGHCGNQSQDLPLWPAVGKQIGVSPSGSGRLQPRWWAHPPDSQLLEAPRCSVWHATQIRCQGRTGFSRSHAT